MNDTVNSIVRELNARLGVDMVPADTASRRPEYPYVSYKVTSSLDSNTFALVDEIVPSVFPGFEYDVEVSRQEQAQFTLSVNTYSMNDSEAHGLAFKVADWFRFTGYFFLVDINVVVVGVTSISDRTQQLVDDYERRYGFDVRCRAARAVKKRVETIEAHIFNGRVRDAAGNEINLNGRRGTRG